MVVSKQEISDPTLGRLEALAGQDLPGTPLKDAPKVLHISLYCFQSFAVRIFHNLTRLAGLNSYALFFKDSLTNRHLPISPNELSLLRQTVRDIAPDLVTISVLAPYSIAARALMAVVREETDAPVITGGKHATISPDEALAYGDYACVGEGELVLLDVFDRLKDGRDFKGIKGLWYPGVDGALVDMGQRPLIQNLDLIPYEALGEPGMYFIEHDRLSQEDPECQSVHMLMMAGRGCVYRCSYCVNSLLIPMNKGNGRFVRMRSPESLVAQILDRRKRQPTAQEITFNDEVFGVFEDWTTEFCEIYGKLEDRLPFNCELVPKLIKEKNISKLAKVGLYEMHFGIQSGSDEVRNNILDRPGKNDELLEKGHLLARYGIQPQCDLILANPFDSAEVMVQTMDLLKQMPRPLRLNIYRLQYFPHYPLTLRALEAGYITEADVTEEAVAENCLYNWIHKPNVWSLERRNYLENCVYLIPWDNALVWWLADKISTRNSLSLAIFINILAAWRYHLDFRQNIGLIWLRRIFISARMILKGDFKALRDRLRVPA